MIFVFYIFLVLKITFKYLGCFLKYLGSFLKYYSLKFSNFLLFKKVEKKYFLFFKFFSNIFKVKKLIIFNPE